MAAGLLLLLALGGGQVQGNLEAAERAYRAGQYEAALALFTAALAEPSVAQGEVLYDLGNCAFRLGRHAEAVLFYRRAQLRLRGDTAVAFNLQLAEQQLGIEPAAASPAAAIAALAAASFTPAERLLLASTLQGLGLAGLLLLRRPLLRFCMLLPVLLGLAGAATLVQEQWFRGPPEGVVLPARIALRAEPRAEGAVTAELGAGETLQVEAFADGWVRVAHARGAGWTERAGVGLVE